MSIPETIDFDKDGSPVPGRSLRGLLRSVFVPLCVVLVGLLSFGLGRLSGAGEKPPVKIDYDPNIISAMASGSATSSAVIPISIQGEGLDTAVDKSASASQSVYASSKGTRYYYMNCQSTVSAANKITFASASEAKAAGYTLATNCKAP